MKELSSIVILIFIIPVVSSAQIEPEIIHIKNHTDLIIDYLPKRIEIEETYLNNYFKPKNHLKKQLDLSELDFIQKVKEEQIEQFIAQRIESALKKDITEDAIKSIIDRTIIEDNYISGYYEGFDIPFNEKINDEITDISKKKNAEIDILLAKRKQRFLEEEALINSEVNEYLANTINFSSQSEDLNSIVILSNTNIPVKEVIGVNSLNNNQLLVKKVKSKSSDYLVQDKQIANNQDEKSKDITKKKEAEENMDQVILAAEIEPKEVVKKDNATDDAIKNGTIKKEEIITKKEENRMLETKEVLKVDNNLVTLSEAEKLELERSRLLKLYRTKFNKITFLVQVSSLNEDIPEWEVANNLGIKERLIKYSINGSIKYFLGGFKTYEKAREKVITLKNEEINSFILVKQENDFILPSLFFQDK